MKDLNKYKSQQNLSEEELVEITRRLIEEKFDREKKAIWTTQLAETHQVRRSLSTNKKKWLYPAIAIAASLLIVVLAIPLWQSFQSPTNQLLAEYTTEKPFPNNLIRKGEDDEIPALRIKATEAYNQAEYVAAIFDYEKLTNSNKATLEDHFYLGLSQLYEKQNGTAVKTLEKAKDRSDIEKRFQQEINWFLALAYVQNEQVERANFLLEEIVEQNHWKAKEAEVLLEQLE